MFNEGELRKLKQFCGELDLEIFIELKQRTLSEGPKGHIAPPLNKMHIATIQIGF